MRDSGFGREVSIYWSGEQKSYVPDMAMLARLERKGLNIHSVGDGKGGVAIISMVMLCAEVMREAGHDLTDEELYAEFRADIEGGYKLFSQVLASFTPDVATGKKLQAPKPKAKKKAAPRKR